MSEATQLTQISDNTNYGTIAGRDVTNVSGAGNQGYIAGGDLYLGDQYVVQETLYFEPDLTEVEPPGWTTTPKAYELVDLLAEQRLLVLAGPELDDKTMVARHLAWLLREELKPADVVVREWYRSSDPQKIEAAFHDKATTILLLPQVQPHHVGHRLGELKRLLKARRHFAIVTAEGNRQDWGIAGGSAEEPLWQELSWETYYGRPLLAKMLLDELGGEAGRLPAWIPQDLFAGSLLADGLSIDEAAARLKAPDRIRQFAHWLRSGEAAAQRDVLIQLDHLRGDRAAILQWYRQLERTDQLLALGLVLFDGLSDDQAFAALEILVQHAWRQSDPNLPLFDYKDLERLSAYFQLSATGEDGSRIETTSRHKREAILQAAWELQRRRLLTVVPAMTQLIKELAPAREAAALPAAPAPRAEKQKAKPAAPKKTEPPAAAPEAAPQGAPSWRFTQGPVRELFSSPRRVEQLQRSVIESLSQIGLLSFEAVEASFLELAVDGSSGFQTVVAKALAAWRGDGHSEKLFRVLRAWWDEGCIATAAKSLAKQSRNDGTEARTAMRATVALAAGYALQYDRPNHLAPEMLGLLESVVQDAHPAVRARVLELTLPLATASHLAQIEPLLRNRLWSDQEQMYAIAFGTAMAFSLRPEEALAVIRRWRAVVDAEGPRAAGDLAVTPRDRLLSAVALAYGYIRCDPDRDLLTPAQVVAELRAILTQETHPFVRTHALMAMGLQAVESFDLVASTLIELISEVTLADRLHVISVLARAYLHQREQLAGGDDEVAIGGRTFRVWTRSARPLTAIETSLYTWLCDDAHPVAQQVALQTFAAIAATDLEQEEKKLAQRRPPVVHTVRPGVTRVAPDAPRLHRLGVLGRFSIRLSTLRHKEVRPFLGPLLAEMVEVRRAERFRIFETAAAAASRTTAGDAARQPAAGRQAIHPAVMQRLHGAADPGLRSLGRTLSVALDVHRWRWAIVLAAMAAAFLLVHDVRDWTWSLGSSLPEADEQSIVQRSAAPLRFAWNQLNAVRLQLEEARRNEAERREKLRLAAARAAAERAEKRALLAGQAPQAAVQIALASLQGEGEGAAAPEKKPPPPPPPTLAERLPSMARFMLARHPGQAIPGAEWLLDIRRPEPPREPPQATPPVQAPAVETIVPAVAQAPALTNQATTPARTPLRRTARPARGPSAPPPEAADPLAAQDSFSQPAAPQLQPGTPEPQTAEPAGERPAPPAAEPTPAPPKERGVKRLLRRLFSSPRPPGGS